MLFRSGRGSLLYPFSCVLGKSKIGKFTTLNVHCSVPHDNITGDYCTFSPYSAIMGHCNIGDECFFGVASYCIPKVTLPAFTKVSAGAIVRKSINDPTILYGDPAAPRQAR